MLLLAAVLLAYRPVWHGTPVWDDDAHITKAELRTVPGLVRIWTEPGATQQYYPLVHSAFWLAHRVWGESVLGYHLLNILLQAASCLLLVCVLWRLEVPGAWLAASIFALHPIEVESVAWISELKNTLSTCLYLGATLAYLGFDRSRSRAAWGMALVLFMLGLMAKSVIATLPAALLVIFWWKRGTLGVRRDVLPLVPFFLAGMAVGLFTAWMEHTYIGASGAEFALTLAERCLVAGRAFWFYLAKLLWPARLVFIYPRWVLDAGAWWQWLYPAAALLAALVLWLMRRRARWPLAALLLFGGTLFPALGFFNVYPFRYSFVADHFQYLAGLAPICIAAAGISRLSRIPRGLVVAALLPLLGFLTWRQCGAYAGYASLWRATLAGNPGCWLARNNLGTALLYQGRVDEAIASYERAIALKPDYAEAHYNMANALARRGDLPAAIAHYRRALALQPRYPEAALNLGVAFARAGNLDEATRAFEQAVGQAPASADAHYNLGLAFYQTGRRDDAGAQFEKTLSLTPDYAGAHRNLAVVLVEQGRLEEAITHYERALALRPADVPLAGDLAWLLAAGPEASLRNGARAVELATRACELAGDSDPAAARTLAAALAEDGKFSRAVAVAARARTATEAGTPLAAALDREIALYRAGLPFRDPAISVPAK